MKERVLVTGAAGFLGQQLLRLLKNHKGAITGTYLKGAPLNRQSKIRYVPLNILDACEVAAFFEEYQPQWVFHLAAMTIPRHSWTDIEGTFQANVRGTLNILEAVRLQKARTRIFFASTIQVYGRSFQGKAPMDEKGTLWPESPYAASKAVAELAILNYGKKFNLDVVIGRFANSVGRGQPSALVFPEWCRKIAAMERGKIPLSLETGNLNVYRDFLHAKDTAQAMVTIMKKGQSGGIYNVASGRVRKLKEHAEYLLKQSSKKIRLKSAARLMRRTEPVRISVSSQRLRKLGWVPNYRVEQGLQDLLQECREHTETAL